MRMRTSGGGEVRLERSERTLRQQRPAGRATKWRVILYHRPNSKSLLSEQAFLHLKPMRMRPSGGGEVRLERSERTLRQQRPAGRATKWRVILYHRPNSKSLLSEQAFLHLKPMRMRTSGGGEVRLERSERTLRQQRPAGRATKWRVILYHRPNSKSLLSDQAFFAFVAHEDENLRGQGGSTRRRPDKTRQRRIRQRHRTYCRMRRDRLIRPTHHTFSCQLCAPYLTIH
ncbi:hypothetical protein AD12_4089 [Escherichia coli 1-392-07_S4_C2]|nr:hypothetical protein AD12_4089 [Escherichia coli 1-392-07_S4_C2]